MEVFINRDLIKETRQANNWTQQHLAQLVRPEFCRHLVRLQ